MAYTEKYCVECSRTLSRKARSPEATAFINACQFTDGNTVRFRKVLVEKDGVCFACGQRDQVMYYEL